MKNCTYFVEGECEQKLLNAIKQSPSMIKPGKVRVFNVTQNKLKNSHLISISEGYVVFVFDTDRNDTNYLEANISKVRTTCPSKVKLLFLVQVPNLEQELVLATDVKKISELTSSRSNKDFKTDFLALKDCRTTLEKHSFDITKMWKQRIPNEFQLVPEQGVEVLIKDK